MKYLLLLMLLTSCSMPVKLMIKTEAGEEISEWGFMNMRGCELHRTRLNETIGPAHMSYNSTVCRRVE